MSAAVMLIHKHQIEEEKPDREHFPALYSRIIHWVLVLAALLPLQGELCLLLLVLDDLTDGLPGRRDALFDA